VGCLAGQVSSALEYTYNNNYYVNSSEHSERSPSRGGEHQKRTMERAMAALALQSATVARARIPLLWNAVIEPTLMEGARSSRSDCPKPAALRGGKRVRVYNNRKSAIKRHLYNLLVVKSAIIPVSKCF
jgi:hypothetical protein